MNVSYNPDNVKAIANTVSTIMEKNIKDIQKETLFSRVLFNDDLAMNIYNNFGKISKMSLILSNEHRQNHYSIVFENKKKTPFQIQSFIKEKMDDDYIYSTYGLITFGKRLYLNDSKIFKLNQQEEQIINSFYFRKQHRGGYDFKIYPISKNLSNSKIDDESLIKVEELANYLYLLKKKYKFNDFCVEEIIKSLLLQNQVDIVMAANFKKIFSENSSKVLTLSINNNIK